MVAHSGFDALPAFGKFSEIGFKRGRHAVAAFRQFARMAFDRLVDAGPGFREPLDICVECLRNDVPGVFKAAGKVARASFEHGRGRQDNVRHLSADLGLALVNHVDEAVLALREGCRDFLGPLDQRFIDLARSRLKGGIQLGSAGVQRLGAGFEFANQALPTLGERSLDVAQACFEFGTQCFCCSAKQRNHARCTIVQQIGQ